MSIQQRVVALLGFFVCASTSQAAGLLAPDTALRHDLTWLSDRGVIETSLTTWPLSQEEIESALRRAKPTSNTEEAVITRVKQRIQQIKSPVRITGYTSTDRPGLPQGFASRHASDHALSIGVATSGDYWDINLKGTLEGNQNIQDRSNGNVDGSYAAVKIFNQWLSFGKVSQWWGPGYEGSLIRSDAARPVTGFLLQRADQSPFATPWLSWLGRWQYQLSAGQLDQYSAVPDAKIIGGRLSIQPTAFFELGASRIMQWGGEGRPRSWGSFWDGVAGRDNTGTANEPGNQLAGFDFKLKMASLVDVPISLYGQLVGEDEAGMLPSKNFYLLGIEGHPEWGTSTINWNIEHSDTRTNGDAKNYTYNHHIYRDGYYQQGYPLAYAAGGDAQVLSGRVELVLDDGQRWKTRVMYAKVNPNSQSINKAFPRADTLKGIEIGWGYDFSSHIKLDTSVWYTDSNHSANDDVGAGIGVEIPINL
ncbi:capsule assembly Wzi family protein [Pectobacterium cacticida]|uniref:Capsule assembly Wzi family protein n=1 Tax=Pectobacterium cacticida TaxID=69221 RepID=A0ABZ2GD36_9GAMM|nr:capsule assembly Wzi family protein [Pectobacterium cacticida]UYX06494.1 capsule assembly Wzi family protein [Pectobacterium cacticida]